MGNALVIFKLYPEGLEDVGKIEESLKTLQSGEVKEVKREPLAFGLEVVIVAVLIPDKESGAMEKLEKEISSLPGVKDAEVTGTTLI